MFAVIRTGGKQYTVAKDDVIAVEKLDGEPGATIELGEVLLIGDGANVSAGTPLLAGASVSATLVEHRRATRSSSSRKSGGRITGAKTDIVSIRRCCRSPGSAPRAERALRPARAAVGRPNRRQARKARRPRRRRRRRR